LKKMVERSFYLLMKALKKNLHGLQIHMGILWDYTSIKHYESNLLK